MLYTTCIYSSLISMGFGKDGLGAILHQSGSLDLGTLAGTTAIKQDIYDFSSLKENFRLLKMEFTGEIILKTANEGPLFWGFCAKDLSVAELEETLEIATEGGPGDIIQTERNMRPVWIMGTLPFTSTSKLVGEDGLILEWKPRWTFRKGLQLWVYNASGSSLTTGATFTHRVKGFGVWVE